MELLLACLFGTLFGFVLYRVGAADPQKIIGMLRLTDLHLMKAILGAIGISSLLLFVGLNVGIIPATHLSVKAIYWGVGIGGLLLGLGWALAGYCPGTGVVALGSGRYDAVSFVVGGLIGAGIFTAQFESIAKTFLFEEIFGGKATLVLTGASTPMIDASWSPVIAMVIGVGFLVLASKLPNSLRECGK